MLEDILLSLNKEDLENLPREAQEKLLALVRAVLAERAKLRQDASVGNRRDDEGGRRQTNGRHRERQS